MASKFMVSSALEARILLRPSYQHTAHFGIIYKLGCRVAGRPMWPPILSSRTYSESSSIPPLPNDSKPAQSRQSSRDEGEKQFSRNWVQFVPSLKKGGMILVGSVGIILVFGAQELWLRDWYGEKQKVRHESAREYAIYEKLKKGPEFAQIIQAAIPRESLVQGVKKLITPIESGALYPLVVGEHGTGKTSLIQLAVESMDKDKPKGVVYVDIPFRCSSEVSIAQAIRKALGWSPDPVIDSNEPPSVEEVLEYFSRAAIKYRLEYKKVPVLIIDNTNRLAQQRQDILDAFQDYAKLCTDQGLATIVFVSSKGRVPRRMTERSSWSRHGKIFEIGDVSKEEALLFLKLQGIDEKQAVKIYELVGGRMIQLRSMADDIKKSEAIDPFQAERHEILSQVRSQLMNAKVFPGGLYHAEGAVIIRELLKNGSISFDTHYGLFSLDTWVKLLEMNVFAFHINSGEITFQSTVMKRYCEENSALWEEK